MQIAVLVCSGGRRKNGDTHCQCRGLLLHWSYSVGILWTSDRPVAEPSTWQQTTLTRQTGTNADGRIRTRNSSKWAATAYPLSRRAVVFKIISLKNTDLKCVTVMWDMSLTPSQKVLSTDEEMIPARNVTTEHARDYVANDVLLLPIPKSFVRADTKVSSNQLLRTSMRSYKPNNTSRTNTPKLTLQPRDRCIVRTLISSHDARLAAQYDRECM